MKKRVIWIISILLILAVSYRLMKSFRSSRRTLVKEEPTSISVAVEEPKIGSIESLLSFVGDIKGEEQVTVFSEVPGKLLRYTVQEGDWIEKGKILGLVDRAVTAMEFEEVKLKSPISGIVGRLYLDKGSTISPQTPVAMVAKMDRVRISFAIAEKDITKVIKGQRAQIRVDAYPGKIFSGKVSRITPVCDSMTRTFPGEIIVANPQHKLKPGMFAEVNIVVETHRNTLLLPREAVLEDRLRNIFYLFVVKDNKAVKKEIEIGLTKNDIVEIESGLKLEEKVIVAGQHYLKGGEKVKIVRGGER